MQSFFHASFVLYPDGHGTFGVCTRYTEASLADAQRPMPHILSGKFTLLCLSLPTKHLGCLAEFRRKNDVVKVQKMTGDVSNTTHILVS